MNQSLAFIFVQTNSIWRRTQGIPPPICVCPSPYQGAIHLLFRSRIFVYPQTFFISTLMDYSQHFPSAKLSGQHALHALALFSSRKCLPARIFQPLMESAELCQIQEKLQALFNVLSRILPVENLHEHPFAFYNERLQAVVSVLDGAIEQSLEEQRLLEQETQRLHEKIDLFCDMLAQPRPMAKEFDNVSLERRFWENEMEKIMVVRGRVETEISALRAEIRDARECLGMDTRCICEYQADPAAKENSCNKQGSREADENSAKQENGKIKCGRLVGGLATDDGLPGSADSKLHEANGRCKCGDAEDDSLISLETLSSLRYMLSLLNNEKIAKESKRQAYYDEIEEVLGILKRKMDFTFEEKICELEALATGLKNELAERKAAYAQCIGEIRNKEKYLGAEPRQFSEAIDSTGMAELAEYRDFLVEEQSRRFDEIFHQTREELTEIADIFGIKMRQYSVTEESLDAMREQINELLPKKELFCEIVELVGKRCQLLQKMTEFEKIASDPKRLFKSSFQLNVEEKFRNTAYPSLLKLEESIFGLLERYEEAFGTFLYEGQEYKMSLKAEVDNRIINRTVFISRCDSPYRKKR